MSLRDWVLIKINGLDAIKYLQGQLTCDVASLGADRFSFAAHCDAKGKMFSYVCIFHHWTGMAFIERRSVCEHQLAALKKYAVFSKTTISTDDEEVLLGLAGFQASIVLRRLFTTVPDASHPVAHNQNATVLFFSLPAPRFLLVTTPKMHATLQHKLAGQAQFDDGRQWLALDIEAGYPVIDIANSTQFIPQAVNAQALDGISFSKGCYSGQEIVARAKYRGANKRALYWLAGRASHLPSAGEDLEIKMRDHWRRTGTVLAACQLGERSIWVQAVLKKDLALDSLLRVREDIGSVLAVQPLPYVIREWRVAGILAGVR